VEALFWLFEVLSLAAWSRPMPDTIGDTELDAINHVRVDQIEGSPVDRAWILVLLAIRTAVLVDLNRRGKPFGTDRRGEPSER
jgi:hypothetical protein